MKCMLYREATSSPQNILLALCRQLINGDKRELLPRDIHVAKCDCLSDRDIDNEKPEQENESPFTYNNVKGIAVKGSKHLGQEELIIYYPNHILIFC